MYVLTVIHGPDQGATFEVERSATAHIGCNDDATFVLTDPMVLKNHCTIVCSADSIVIRNNTASAGTYVGDKKISQARVRPGVTFRIGDSHIKITAKLASTTPSKPASSGGASASGTGGRRPSQNDPLLGKIVGGYKFNEVLGVGGMGTVYKATQLSLQREVAVKVLRNKLAKDKSYCDMFINEARAAAELVHPNVVQVYDAGTEGEISYFSMEYIGQGSVEEILAEQGSIDWKEAILQVLEAAHGLEYAEGRGIVHRDIKPDNLMLNDDGRIKIADLGLAKKGEGGADEGIIGTPHFIPPEQALGKNVDSRADIYSLGATFFRMITGKTVFTGKTAKEIVLKHIKEPAPAASSINKEIPGDLDLVIAKMLAKDPDARYADTKELIGALEEVCAHHGIKGSIIKQGVGKRVLIPLILLILAGGGTIFWLVNQEPKTVVNQDEIDRANQAEAARKKAEKEREAERIRSRKGELGNVLLRLNNKRLLTNSNTPLDSTYDDEKLQASREQIWNGLVAEYREFAGGDAKDLTPDLAAEANKSADQIVDRLAKLKKGAQHKKTTIATYVRELEKSIAAQKSKLAGYRAKRQYNAALALCALIGAEKPGKNDPLGRPEKWVYEYGDVKTPATEIPAILKTATEARKYFRDERDEILAEVTTYWQEVEKKANVKDLVDNGTDKQIEEAIKELEEVAKGLSEPESTPLAPELAPTVTSAKNMAKSLRSKLDARRKTRLVEDRRTVATLQRRMVSLDPDVNPNLVMQSDFKDAAAEWRRAKDRLATDKYRRFAVERAEMLEWCHWLLVKFHGDMAAGGNAFRTKTVEYPIQGSARPKKTSLKRPAGDSPLSFSLTHRDRVLGPRGVYRMSQFPMDWIHGSLFMYRADVRWTEVTPAIRFALAAYCFETMMYDLAAGHFDKLASDASYGEAAKRFAARAREEAKAKKAWLDICAATEKAKTTADIKAIRKSLGEYRMKFEGSLFYLEVMPAGATIARDFFDELSMPTVPAAPDN